MEIAEKIYEKLRCAPDDVLQEVLDFIGYLEMKRRLSSKPTRIEQDMGDVKFRLGKLESRLAGLERGQTDIHETLAHHSVKSDRVDSRMERIEKRLDLIDS